VLGFQRLGAALRLVLAHQPSAALIDYLRRGEKDFVFQVVEVVVIEVKASLEGTIGYPSLAFEQFKDLGENVIEGHGVTLHCAGFHCFAPLR
jgi:hypothetical protein